jgi:hypothetical protein
MQICVQVFKKLIADWCGASQEEDKVGQHLTRSPSSRLGKQLQFFGYCVEYVFYLFLRYDALKLSPT